MNTSNMNEAIKQRLLVFQTVLDQIPALRYAGDHILRQAATPATLAKGLALGKKLAPVLLKYREITGAGRGLAAPQIGESKAVFITYIDDRIELFINPRIVEKAGTTSFYRELCLSTGIFGADVERPEWIVMEWTDEAGEQRREKIAGFKARLCQHEEAHLRGHLIIDDAAPFGIEFATFDPLQEKLRDTR